MKSHWVFALGLATGLCVSVAMGALLSMPASIAEEEHGAAAESELAWLPADQPESLLRIEAHLRGTDVTMWEIGYRFTELYHAGLDRNWDYADYQLEKIPHALQLAMERRPKRAESAQPFLNEVVPAVQALVAERDSDAFMRGMERLRTGCMQCHVAEEVPFFTVSFPELRASSIAPLPDDAAIDW